MVDNQTTERYDTADDTVNDCHGDNSASTAIRELCANGLSMGAAEVAAKLDNGNILDAESSLREGLSLNSEEARAFLGRLEYQRGNLESALCVFDGIDLQAAIQRLQPSILERPPSSRKGRSRSESNHAVSLHAANMVIGAIYLKAKSLQKLGRLTEAAHECQSLLNAVETIFCHETSDVPVDSRLQETVSQALELLPELWKKAGCYQEALSTYRHAIIKQWNIDNDSCARIQKAFAAFLLYSGVEFSPPRLTVQFDGLYVPRNNLEEAILLLLIILRKFHIGKAKWDPLVIELLTFALSMCGQTSVLAKQLEEVMPGTFHRVDRWKSLALCYCGVGQNQVALNLLKKSLHKHEKPDDLIALLLASKICAGDSLLATEGVGFAKTALIYAQGINGHLKGVGLCLLGLCLGKQAKVSSSDFERFRLQSEALKSLDEAVAFEPNNADLIFNLGVQYAEHRNLNTALHFAKQFIDATGGSILKGWRLLVLVLSAQLRFSEAEAVVDAALDEIGKLEQGPLLRMKAHLEISQSLLTDAIETFRLLLALIQAQKKSFRPSRSASQDEDHLVEEFEVWHDLANLYSSLSRWRDAEICLEKARVLKQYSAAMLNTEGIMYEGQELNYEALSAYVNAHLLEADYVPCKISLGSLLLKIDSVSVPIARSLLSDTLRIEPTSRMAWYHLGVIHKNDGHMTDAADCFQAACILKESDPIEKFSSLL